LFESFCFKSFCLKPVDKMIADMMRGNDMTVDMTSIDEMTGEVMFVHKLIIYRCL
jgi:hypothetical protein